MPLCERPHLLICFTSSIFENCYKNEKYSHFVRLAALQSLPLMTGQNWVHSDISGWLFRSVWEKPTPPAAGRGQLKKKLRGVWSALQVRHVLWDETLFRQWYLWVWYLLESQIWRDSRRGRGGTDRENMGIWLGELIRQAEYGICYEYVKYGGWISVRFLCKIKDLSGVVVFSINNSSLIGNICLYPLCVVNRFRWDWFTSVYLIYKLKIQETPPPPSATIHLFLWLVLKHLFRLFRLSPIYHMAVTGVLRPLFRHPSASPC